LKLVSRIRVITHLRGRLRTKTGPTVVEPLVAASVRPPRPDARRSFAALVVGASTGGPGAVVDLFRALPADFPLPILLVLHIGEPFGVAFAEWLDGRIDRRVVFATDGEMLGATAGRVSMAPPGRHMVVREGRLGLNTDPERNFCRPSVDVLFESVARELGPSAIACLLTGMGRDGAAGLLAIRQAGGATIAQDEATCIVYGMPREAVLLNAAERVLPLDEIGPAVTGLAGRGGDRPA
jgi:two-component system chemotaxis response regulator CheB